MNEIAPETPLWLQRVMEWLAPLRGALIWAMGPLNNQLAYLFLAIAIDTVLAAYNSMNNGMFSLRLLIKRAFEKVVIYSFWIMLFNAVENLVAIPGIAPRTMAIIALLGLELQSCARNTSRMGHTNISRALTVAFKGVDQATGGVMLDALINDDSENKK